MKISLILLLIPIFGLSQPPNNRYQVEIFSSVIETNNITFSTNVPQPNPGGGFYEWISGYPLNVEEYNTSPVNLKMDIFQPAGDTLSKRPVIIICFGGGFLSGSRDYWSIRLLCQRLAKMGFVTAAIDYRLGMNVFDEDLAMRAVYRGIQDGRSAVRFFRSDANGANNYKIDPDHIFMGGHSSGAFIALHNAYLEKESERPNSTYTWIQDGQIIPDQLCLDCVGDNTSEDGHANAVFSLAGALGFTSYIEQNDDPNVVMFHSTDDGTVPYNSGTPFSSILWLVVGADLPTVYGSLPISIQATSVGLPYEFNSYSNRGHGVHEDGSSDLYNDIVPSISGWFFTKTLKPTYDKIKGDSVICTSEMDQMYTLGEGIGYFFDWNVVGGSFTQMNNYSDTVYVQWDNNASARNITVTSYSSLDAEGDLLTLNINVYPSANNTFLGLNDDWSEISNWSEGVLPAQCHDINIPDSNEIYSITLDDFTTINSLNLGQNRLLNITQNGFLSIYQKSNTFLPYALTIKGEINNNGMIQVSNKQISKEVNSTLSGSTINGDSGIVILGVEN